MLLCGGDGLADVIGKRIASERIPWSAKKSVAGTAAMFLGGWLASVIVLAVFVAVKVLPGPFSSYLLPVTGLALVATAVESLPVQDLDNLTVPLTAVLLGLLVF